MLFIPALAGLLIAGLIGLALAIQPGAKVYDRILALNFIGTLTVLFIAVIGFVFGRPEFLDIAVAYALINFIGTIAVLKYLKSTGETPAIENLVDENLVDENLAGENSGAERRAKETTAGEKTADSAANPKRSDQGPAS